MKSYIFPVLWTALISILSSIPGSDLPDVPFAGFDKVAHLGLYLVLGFLWASAVKSKFLLTILLGASYGALDEVHQIFVPLRTFSVFDILFDGIGVVCGVSIWRLLLKK